MKTTAAAKAKEATLPDSATITIRDQKPSPEGEVEVTPKGGRVHFENLDDREYRLRLWKPGTKSSIDILLPANNCVSVIIKKDDEFRYLVLDINEEVKTGGGGGGIRN